MSIFDAAIFDEAIFDTGVAAATGFIPRGSVAALATPDRPSATVTVPSTTATVTTPDRPTAEID